VLVVVEVGSVDVVAGEVGTVVGSDVSPASEGEQAATSVVSATMRASPRLMVTTYAVF
jgi:hypothetical protein